MPRWYTRQKTVTHPSTNCTLNIRSILHPLHSAALSDLIDTHNPDLLCLTETWIKPTTTAAELLNCTPPHYSLISTPRNGSNKILSSGGGTAFLVREPFTQLSASVPSSSVTLQLSHSKLSVFNIYRPPSSSTYSKPLIFDPWRQSRRRNGRLW